jgi:mono/diheme cytochrome c family protein
MLREGIALLAACIAVVTTAGASANRVADANASPSAPAHPQPPVSALTHAGLLEQYCAKCHNTVDWAGGVAFDVIAVDPPAAEAASWEKAIRKMRTGLMPPPGEKRPSRDELQAFAGELEAQLDEHAQGHLAPGVTALHRLNRTEYANAVRDVLDYEADVSTLLPADDSAEGFDNIADVLGISPTLAQAYIAAAMKISRGALGDLTATPATAKYTAPGGQAQRAHIDGLPIGTEGGIRFTHYFPVDAEYEFRITPSRPLRFAGSNGGPPPKSDFVLDGIRVEMQDPAKFRLRVTAGPHTVSVALIDRVHWNGVDELYAKAHPPRDVLSSVSINGPFDPTGTGDTPSRRAVFTCHPVKEKDEAPCARRILARLASKAFRRPVAERDPSIDTFMSFYETARASGGFEQGVQQGLARLLADPRFLYRAESEPADLAPGSIYRVSDLDLASRLSFFLWSSIPDPTLVTLASSGKLSNPTVLEQQVRRMLADSRSRALVDNFGGQWLRLRELHNVQPLDGGFDDNLREGFEQETKLLFSDLVREDLPITHLLDSSYTYLNERLARHYGMADVHGSYMRKVSLPESSPRRGLLGQGSILTLTSAGNRTSPVMRGSWVLDTVLAAPPPRPPPGVETDLKGEGDAAHAKSVRQRLELHRSNKTCASCHQIMDPIGFSLENFDLLGRWRDTDGAMPVDASGTLMDGTALQGAADLRRFLLSQPDQFATSAAEKLLTYALGRRLEATDQPAVRQIVRQSKAQGYRFSSLVLGVVDSVPFQMRVKE